MIYQNSSDDAGEQKMLKNKLIKLIIAALIGALYVVLTMLVYPIAFTGLQFRVSEALTVLPFLYPPATLGLFIGCAISNFASPLGWIDIVFGSLATLLSGLITARIKNKWLAPLPPVIINAVVVGLIIAFTSGNATPWVFLVAAAQVAAGQLVSCYGLGIPLLLALQKLRVFDKYIPVHTAEHRRKPWTKQ